MLVRILKLWILPFLVSRKRIVHTMHNLHSSEVGWCQFLLLYKVFAGCNIAKCFLAGERQKVLNWLLSYNPLWLRIGLEVSTEFMVYNQRVFFHFFSRGCFEWVSLAFFSYTKSSRLNSAIACLQVLNYYSRHALQIAYWKGKCFEESRDLTRIPITHKQFLISFTLH